MPLLLFFWVGSMDEPSSSGSLDGVASGLIDLGVETAVVTLGGEGCFVARRRQSQ